MEVAYPPLINETGGMLKATLLCSRTSRTLGPGITHLNHVLGKQPHSLDSKCCAWGSPGGVTSAGSCTNMDEHRIGLVCGNIYGKPSFHIIPIISSSKRRAFLQSFPLSTSWKTRSNTHLPVLHSPSLLHWQSLAARYSMQPKTLHLPKGPAGKPQVAS